MRPVHRQKISQGALGVIFCIMLMDIIGINILHPIAPYLVKRYKDEALMVTMLTVVYAAAQFFAAPLFGKPGDRCRRRPVLLVSILGAAIGYVILGIGGALWALLFARLIGGITVGNLSTASAYIADISDLKDRAKNFGFIGVAWGVGLIVGPALGNFAFNGINSTQTLFLIDKFAIQPWQLGSLMVVGSITAAAVQAVLVQRLVSRYREKAVAV